MTRRLIFVDLDGTLVDHRGQVPQSARASVRQARDNGHLVFLCTGRSIPQLWPAITDMGFDGVVAAGGGYVEVGGHILLNHAVAEEDVRHIVHYFDAQRIDYLLESQQRLLGSDHVQQHLRQAFYGPVEDARILSDLRGGLAAFIDTIIVGADPAQDAINKVLFLDSPISLDVISREFADVLQVIPASVSAFGPNSGELVQTGVHKASGIDVVTRHLGFDHKQTVAIGDGYNDLEMLTHANLGIAMASAPELLLDAADEVTGTPEEDGLHAAFHKHGLLGRPALADVPTRPGHWDCLEM